MFLLDTTVLSEQVRLAPDAGVARWLERQSAALIYLSVVSVGEVTSGMAHRPDDRRNHRIRGLLDAAIESLDERVLPVSLEVSRKWGELNGDALRRGQPLPTIDSLIAATALVHDLVVVTRNTRHFERCGARVLSPWTAR
jgi:predicted nucleic acid-binding protein